jgi:hypothetical protein
MAHDPEFWIMSFYNIHECISFCNANNLEIIKFKNEVYEF